jgi:predicted TIM-barrel fold metal-dependent hydrolase
VSTANIIDTHVHVFQRDAALAPGRRYAPSADATPDDLWGWMQPAGVDRAVLVQPSFLGFDNSYLLDAIGRDPGRFLGVAVVPSDTGRNVLADLRRGGVVGIRLNCIGHPAPDLAGEMRPLVQNLAALGMTLQIQAEGAQWLALEAALSDSPGPVVIDHFGRTAPGDASGGFESLLRAAARSPRIWFKFSAPYRFADGAAAGCAGLIRDTVGIDRIIWGSDWPHTQFEGRFGYGATLDWLSGWLPRPEDRRAVMAENPARLFGL